MNTTTTRSSATQSTWPKIALRWMPTFLGFPLGGFVAEAVGRVDSVAPAVAGGAITGAILGLVQCLGMRRSGPGPELWIVASAAGFAAGLGAAAAAVGYRTDNSSLAVQGAICGAVVGIAQASVLYRTLGRLAIAWPPLLSAAWALGWTITAAAGIDVEAQYTVFGSSGAIVVTAISSVLPIALANRRRPEVG